MMMHIVNRHRMTREILGANRFLVGFILLVAIAEANPALNAIEAAPAIVTTLELDLR